MSSDIVEVTQADREAARSHYNAVRIGGLGDGISLADRFAKHRIATEQALTDHIAALEAKLARAEERERCARVADQHYSKWGCAGGFENFATGAKVIAQAIRSLGDQPPAQAKDTDHD